jgi:hypothetical protein
MPSSLEFTTKLIVNSNDLASKSVRPPGSTPPPPKASPQTFSRVLPLTLGFQNPWIWPWAWTLLGSHHPGLNQPGFATTRAAPQELYYPRAHATWGKLQPPPPSDTFPNIACHPRSSNRPLPAWLLLKVLPISLHDTVLSQSGLAPRSNMLPSNCTSASSFRQDRAALYLWYYKIHVLASVARTSDKLIGFS